MIENTITLGPGGRLVATLCRPSPHSGNTADALSDSARKVAFVLMNAGIIHRIGPHRMNVKIARRLAKAGIASIRLDLSGLGDSDRNADDVAYGAQSVLDIQAAMDALTAECGVTAFALFGLCSGTINSFAAAAADERVIGLYLMEPYVYPTWRTQATYLGMRLKKYLEAGRFIQGIRKLGEAIPRKILSRFASKATGTNVDNDTNGNKGATFFLGQPTAPDFSAMLMKLANRGVSVCLVYAGSTFQHFNYQTQFEDAFRSLKGSDRVRCEFMSDADHTLTRIAAQHDFLSRIESWARSLLRERH